jgi:hypothetical protein
LAIQSVLSHSVLFLASLRCTHLHLNANQVFFSSRNSRIVIRQDRPGFYTPPVSVQIESWQSTPWFNEHEIVEDPSTKTVYLKFRALSSEYDGPRYNLLSRQFRQISQETRIIDLTRSKSYTNEAVEPVSDTLDGLFEIPDDLSMEYDSETEILSLRLTRASGRKGVPSFSVSIERTAVWLIIAARPATASSGSDVNAADIHSNIIDRYRALSPKRK